MSDVAKRGNGEALQIPDRSFSRMSKACDSPTICPLTVSLSLGPNLFRSKRWSVNEGKRKISVRKEKKLMWETEDPAWRLCRNPWPPHSVSHLRLKKWLKRSIFHVWGHIHCSALYQCMCVCTEAALFLSDCRCADRSEALPETRWGSLSLPERGRQE